MSMSVYKDSNYGVFGTGDSEVLRRIYGAAKAAVGAHIALDSELERRLAVIVLFAYGAEVQSHRVRIGGDEDGIARTCAARLMAQTSAS